MVASSALFTILLASLILKKAFFWTLLATSVCAVLTGVFILFVSIKKRGELHTLHVKAKMLSDYDENKQGGGDTLEQESTS